MRVVVARRRLVSVPRCTLMVFQGPRVFAFYFGLFEGCSTLSPGVVIDTQSFLRDAAGSIMLKAIGCDHNVSV